MAKRDESDDVGRNVARIVATSSLISTDVVVQDAMTGFLHDTAVHRGCPGLFRRFHRTCPIAFLSERAKRLRFIEDDNQLSNACILQEVLRFTRVQNVLSPSAGHIDSLRFHGRHGLCAPLCHVSR